MAAVARDVVSTRHKLLSLIDDVEIATKYVMLCLALGHGINLIRLNGAEMSG